MLDTGTNPKCFCQTFDPQITFPICGNGIVGDMCIHMFDTVRWMLGLGWPQSISSTGGIYVQKEGKSNISDTQSAIFKYDGLNCVWQHRSWGNPVDPDYPWAFKLYGEKGVLAGSTMRYDFTNGFQGYLFEECLWDIERKSYQWYRR